MTCICVFLSFMSISSSWLWTPWEQKSCLCFCIPKCRLYTQVPGSERAFSKYLQKESISKKCFIIVKLLLDLVLWFVCVGKEKWVCRSTVVKSSGRVTERVRALKAPASFCPQQLETWVKEPESGIRTETLPGMKKTGSDSGKISLLGTVDSWPKRRSEKNSKSSFAFF